MITNKRSILKRDIDLETAKSPIGDRVRLIGSIIVVLSGTFLYLDKAIPHLDVAAIMPEKFNSENLDPGYFVWLCGVTFSPLLIIIGAILRAHIYAYAVPIYCYILQAYFILIDYSLIDDGYSYAYSFGMTVILLLMMVWVKNASQRKTKLMLEEAKARINKYKNEHVN